MSKEIKFVESKGYKKSWDDLKSSYIKYNNLPLFYHYSKLKHTFVSDQKKKIICPFVTNLALTNKNT